MKCYTRESHIISWGGGVNSTAIIALFILGKMKGRPEIVFADTGAELPETYSYMEAVKKILASSGFGFTRLSPREKGGLYSKRAEGHDLYDFLWTMQTVPGIKWRFCTQEYKTRPMKRYSEGRVQMLGICADELKRIKYSDNIVYPIRDYTRDQCAALIELAGLPEAHKTGCWFCPFQRKQQWIDLYLNHADLWQKAVELEERSIRWKFLSNGRTLLEQMDRWIGEQKQLRLF